MPATRLNGARRLTSKTARRQAEASFRFGPVQEVLQGGREAGRKPPRASPLALSCPVLRCTPATTTQSLPLTFPWLAPLCTACALRATPLLLPWASLSLNCDETVAPSASDGRDCRALLSAGGAALGASVSWPPLPKGLASSPILVLRPSSRKSPRPPSPSRCGRSSTPPKRLPSEARSTIATILPPALLLVPPLLALLFSPKLDPAGLPVASPRPSD